MTMRALGVLAASGASGCLSFGDRVIEREFPREENEPSLIVDVDAAAPVFFGDAGLGSIDPHALLAISPNHGPFTGGQTVTLRGNGFASNVRVWFGEVPAEDVIAIDPNRIQATTPEGAPGSVAVAVQLGDDVSTRRVLSDGYEYDAFTVEPKVGPVTGGSLITLSAPLADWDEQTSVTIDLEPCEVTEVRSVDDGLSEIDCRTPEGTPGKKVVTVETSGGARASVPDGFAYSDFATEFEGGLSGDPLDGRLEVRVLSGLSGQHVEGARVIVGTDFDERRVKSTDQNGSAVFENGDLGDVPLGDVETVTVLMPCMHPLTIVDVPVERATLYIEPLLTPECIPPSSEIPVFGGGAAAAPRHQVSGELVWGEGLELRRGPWLNVPAPSHDQEQRIAYVFELSSSPGGNFNLPGPFDAVTQDSAGTFGYSFVYDTRSLGNITLYALAGVEDTSTIPRRFTPYAMGVVRGIDPLSEPSGILMSMDITLDHELALDIEPPVPTGAGPDRAEVEVSLRLGASGYVRLPNLRRQELLPRSSPIAFVGVPALAKGLERAEYIASVTAVSGPDAALPRSHIELISTRETNRPILVSDFVPVPLPVAPMTNAEWNGHTLSLDFAPGGSFDLLRIDVIVPARATTWRIIAPAARREVELPRLEDHGVVFGGRATIGVAAARIRNFDFSVLKERHFGSGGWTAYATNAFPVVLE